MKHSCDQHNTARVVDQHHVLTQSVLNEPQMKTVGERIRQAREHRGLSAESLASKVGYKTQSGISNLENRATGRGGFMLSKIAEELNFSVAWFLQGPDTNDMSTVAAFREEKWKVEPLAWPPKTATESTPREYSPRMRAHQLIDQLSEKGISHALELLEALSERHPCSPAERAGIHFPATRKNVA